MAYEVVMPQLGLSMDSGQIIEWLKKPGDSVKAGELLLVVESDKSSIEVEAVESGVLYVIREPEDGAVPVGEVIAYLLAEGENPPNTTPLVDEASPLSASMVPFQSKPDEQKHLSGGNGNYPQPGRPSSSPAARRRARELGVNWLLARPSGVRGQIKERDVLALAASNASPAFTSVEAVQITPVARRLAEFAGLDIARLAERNPGKRLERADVEQAIRDAVAASRSELAAEGQPTPADERSPQRKPAGSLRRLIGGRMSESAHTTAPVTLTTDADASELVRIRSDLKTGSKSGVVPGYNALFAGLVARALVEYPYMNASLDGEEVVFWDTVNISIAVDTERGLVVPVLRNVQEKSMRALAAEFDELLTRAAQGKALPDELTGSTFTITNLGSFEIDAFTPIINLPNCAVLGVGRLVKRIVPVDDQPAVRTMVALSLTFDHRLVDGAPAARFLQRIKQFVEHPYLWLI